MNIENQNNGLDKVQDLDESIKKYDELMSSINSEAKKAELEAEQAKENIKYNDTLIEKIINNAIIMMKSAEVQKIVDKLKDKVDTDTIVAIINLTVYASSAAVHQAIMYYDELLSSKLKMDFAKIERIVQEKCMETNTLQSVIEVLSARINEVRKEMQINSLENK